MKLPVSILFISLSSTAFSAELVLNNGNILQVDSGFNTASAVAIDAGKIVAIGSDKEVSTHINDSTVVIDLEGRTVIPGLIDNHMHLVRAAQNWGHQVRLEGITDYQQALKQIADTAARAKPGQWLVASGGFVERQFAGRPKAGFLRTDLDKAAPDNPVYLQHLFDWGYANSAALQTIGVNPDSPPQMPGLLLDGNGLPQGPVTKRAQFLLEEQLTANTKQNRLEQSRKALKDLARSGLTTVVDAGGFDTVDSLYEPLKRLTAKAKCPSG
ncbi:amidohydrolase family protein [Aliamphritea spongicola]|nr:amidohydrolase family protein [Aliamphritea spongicola]